jgi:hypothetical protein
MPTRYNERKDVVRGNSRKSDTLSQQDIVHCTLFDGYLLVDSTTISGYVPVHKIWKEQIIDPLEGQQDQADVTVDRRSVQCLCARL